MAMERWIQLMAAIIALFRLVLELRELWGRRQKRSNRRKRKWLLLIPCIGCRKISNVV